MKFPVDPRKLKKLDIKVSYIGYLRKSFLFFDNLIINIEEGSRKMLLRPLNIRGFGRLCRKVHYSLKGIETHLQNYTEDLIDM